VFLYLLFGFTIGLFLYLVSTFTQLGGIAEGFNLYLIFSISIMVLFSLKIITLRFIGFLFDVPRLVREYVSILYRSEEHTSELQSRENLVCRLLLEKKKQVYTT